MDEKSLTTLEYYKVLERLAAYTDFSASAEFDGVVLAGI